ncbi:MAG: transporter substrate-binding domain-containing protein [Clostridiales Family XIII bacterium]|jgi:polar amino acid transport system substrate-binding protein|nr:transporter substrate-binding domain-containing protein [Clostridiales Family XIII bacterium]
MLIGETSKPRRVVAILFIVAVMLGGAAPVFAADYTDYMGASLGACDGEIYGELAEDLGWSDDIHTYSLFGDMLEAISSGKIEAGITASVACNAVMAEGEYTDLDFLPVPKEIHSDANSAVFKDAGLRDKFNEWAKLAKEDGTLDELDDRWLSGKLPPADEIPVIPNDGTGGTLVCAIATGYAPMAYMGENNKAVGYEIEVAERFAKFCNMKIRFDDMSYGAILPAIQSGKADFSNVFTITDEREANILFGDNILDVTAYFIVKKSSGGEAGGSTGKTYEDFIGKQFGVITGTIFDQIANDAMKSRDTLYFSERSSMFEAIKGDKIDACLTDAMLAKITCQKLDGLNYIMLPEEIYSSEIGAISEDIELLEQFDVFLGQLKDDGTFDKIQARWLDDYDYRNPPALPEFPEAGANGELTIATEGTLEPYIFRSGDMYTGMDAEFAVRFAASLGKTVKWETMDFTGLIPYVVSGKADISFSGISITEERQRQVHFSKPYTVQYIGLLYHDENTEESGGGFLNWLKNGVENNLVQEGRYKLILSGLGVTLKISALSLLFGTILGAFMCFLLTRRNKAAKGIAKFYCGFIHGTPEVTLLMVAYYIIFGNSNIAGYLVAVAAFSLVCGARVATNLSGAIDTVDKTEIEAARALGFSSVGTFMKVTLPQAVRRALPGYTEGFVGLVKSTAVVGYIAIQDLTRATDIIRSRTFDAYFPVILSAVIYLALTTLMIVVFKFIIKKVNRSVQI